MCQSQSPSSSCPPPPAPIHYHTLVLYICVSLCFADKFICIIFLDSTCKQYCMIFIFLFLTHLTLWQSLDSSTFLQMARFHSFWCVLVTFRSLSASPVRSFISVDCFFFFFWLWFIFFCFFVNLIILIVFWAVWMLFSAWILFFVFNGCLTLSWQAVKWLGNHFDPFKTCF